MQNFLVRISIKKIEKKNNEKQKKKSFENHNTFHIGADLKKKYRNNNGMENGVRSACDETTPKANVNYYIDVSFLAVCRFYFAPSRNH